MANRKNLLGYSEKKLEQFFLEINEPSFRAKQLLKWVHQQGELDFSNMSNFNKPLREKMKEIAVLIPPKLKQVLVSDDGTKKYLIELDSGSSIEMVRIPEKKRITLCISSQAGCALACTFCATGAQGFEKNLTADEIIGQLWLANFHDKEDTPITNVVFMGMGEPLMNYKNLINAIDKITQSEGLGMSPSRITVSTSGIPKMIMKMADDQVRFGLAVSLHSARQELREQLMPFAEKFPLNDLAESIKYWYKKTAKAVTYEYVVWQGINDGDEDINALVDFCKISPCKVNLIEYNPIGDDQFLGADKDRIEAYESALEDERITVTVRRSRGKDIDAACGQLANKAEGE